MRKQINGLSALVQESFSSPALSGDLFIFCNKRRNRLKILYWQKNGFCLWLKRLEKHKFPWPKDSEHVIPNVGMITSGRLAVRASTSALRVVRSGRFCSPSI